MLNLVITFLTISRLNIIMKNTTFTLPFIYLLQTHFSFFALFGCKNVGLHSYAIAGSPLPYRAYIDCGTVLLCAISLGFASPLVAPCAAFFFLWSEPIMRRCFIYVVRLLMVLILSHNILTSNLI